MLIVLFIATCAVAFTNGANANFKGVAFIYGSGTASLRTTIWCGTATTFAGAITSLFVVRGLLAAFSGKGLVRMPSRRRHTSSSPSRSVGRSRAFSPRA